MKRFYYLPLILFIGIFIACDNDDEDNVELIPGQIIEQTGTYYESCDAGLGDKTVEGYIDLSNLSSLTGELGIPKVEISLWMGCDYTPQGEDYDVRYDVPGLENSFVYPNIETGYYKFSGLPEVADSMNNVNISVNDTWWLSQHPSLSVIKRFSSGEWNNLSEIVEMETVTYLEGDLSISLTVNFKYMVDTYWLENGEFESEENGANYTELTYSEFDNIATVGISEQNPPMFFVNQPMDESGIYYSVINNITQSDYERQKRVIKGFAGRNSYQDFAANIYVNNNSYESHMSLSTPFMLTGGQNETKEFTFYIPNR